MPRTFIQTFSKKNRKACKCKLNEQHGFFVGAVLDFNMWPQGNIKGALEQLSLSGKWRSDCKKLCWEIWQPTTMPTWLCLQTEFFDTLKIVPVWNEIAELRWTFWWNKFLGLWWVHKTCRPLLLDQREYSAIEMYYFIWLKCCMCIWKKEMITLGLLSRNAF